MVEAWPSRMRAAADADVRLVRPQASRLAARFMDVRRCFPIPATGAILRQPLYAGDFCDIIVACIETASPGAYNITGQERIDYIDLIRAVRDAGATAHADRAHPLRPVLAAAAEPTRSSTGTRRSPRTNSRPW